MSPTLSPVLKNENTICVSVINQFVTILYAYNYVKSCFCIYNYEKMTQNK